jgi:hypothetical protein
VPYHIQTLGLQITQANKNDDEYYILPKQMRPDLNFINNYNNRIGYNNGNLEPITNKKNRRNSTNFGRYIIK